MGAPRRITIVGAGLAGSLLALELADRGLAVTLIDAATATTATSTTPTSTTSATTTATALSYGGVAWWAGGGDALGRLTRQAPARWRRLQHRHGFLGWRGCGLRFHGGGWGGSLLPPPFAQVDSAVLMRALPGCLAAAGIALRQARLLGPPQPLSDGWRLALEPGGAEEAEQVVLAAGAGCRALAPGLPSRLRSSWAGVLALPALPSPAPGSASPWLRHAAARRLVQPRHWQRPQLEAQAPGLQAERWIVDAGFAPWGEGLLLGQISLVRPGLDTGAAPAAALMERRLRRALAALDPLLAALPGPYRQVPVAFCVGGLPLAGPLPGAPGLWVFSGFAGGFAQVPVLAPLLADVIAGTGDREFLAGLGVLPG